MESLTPMTLWWSCNFVLSGSLVVGLSLVYSSLHHLALDEFVKAPKISCCFRGKISGNFQAFLLAPLKTKEVLYGFNKPVRPTSHLVENYLVIIDNQK